MFKLSRPKSGRSSSHAHGDRFSFHFSNFQVLQVPEGWEKLSVALVSMRTGKSIAKLGKETVHNESCQWTETLTESILVSQDEGNSKDIEESPLKFVVTMGTTKTGVLGEATINLARYISSKASTHLSLPLSKCDHGTTLQLKIQCQTPRKYREDEKTDSNSHGDYTMEGDEPEATSNSALSRSIGSSSSNHMEHTNEDEEFLSKEEPFSDSSGKDKVSHKHKKSTRTSNKQIKSQDSTDSDKNRPAHSLTSTDDGIRTNDSFAQQTVPREELQAEARELNAKKSMLGIESSDIGGKELEDEIRLLKESNADLAEQLQKARDSNVELMSILQELEVIIESQKADIEKFSSEKLKLEADLNEKSYEIEAGHRLKDEALLECESKWSSMLAEKEEEIVSLEEQITQSMEDEGGHEEDSGFPHEVEFLNTKLEELERECTELIEENMQLVHKLKEAKKSSSKEADRDDSSTAGDLNELGDQVTSLQKEIDELKSSMESLEAANKLLERESSGLETAKEELELHLSKLEEENMQLSERVSKSEAQQRLITDEKEESKHKLKQSDGELKKLREEITRLESEREAQKVEGKQKLQNMQKRWLEAQEECEYLKKANPKLEVTVGNLMDECTSLQKLNANLKRQNKELHKYRSSLEAWVNDSDRKFSKCSSAFEALEAEFGTMLEVIAFKEASIKSELETLVKENKDLKEKVAAEEKLVNEMYLEKSLEVENLQKELIHLLDQISTLSGGGAKYSASEAIVELCSLRTEKSKLEISVEEFREKFESTERKLNARQLEAEAKVGELMAEITSSKLKHDVLLADHKKLKAKLQNVKSRKKKYRGAIRDLEKKLKVSEHEKLQVEEEISVHKAQKQRAAQLQEEIVTFKNSLDEAKFEIKRLHASYDLLSGDHEELVSESVLLAQELGTAEDAISELEEYKTRKSVMEEKISRLEADLNAREALAVQDAEMRIELGRTKRANNELLRKVKYLEEDREEYLKKIKASDGGSEDGMADYLARIQSLENELAKALEASEMYQSQLSRFLSDEQTSSSSSSAKQNGANAKGPDDSLVWSLQAELKDIRERYFEMSLKYAEVEAQREELVMKLKSKNNKKGDLTTPLESKVIKTCQNSTQLKNPNEQTTCAEFMYRKMNGTYCGLGLYERVCNTPKMTL